MAKLPAIKIEFEMSDQFERLLNDVNYTLKKLEALQGIWQFRLIRLLFPRLWKQRLILLGIYREWLNREVLKNEQ